MPGRPAKKGQKYNVGIEVKGPQGKAEFTAFKKGLKAALAKVKGKLGKGTKTGKAEPADT